MTTFSRRQMLLSSTIYAGGVVALICAGCRPLAAQSNSASTRYSPVTRIRFFPAPGQAAGMKGGRFTGSITSATNDFEELARIEKDVIEGQWNEVAVTGKPLYSFLKYEAEPNTGAAVAEIEFHSSDRKMTGTAFSTVPGDGKTPDAAFDGKTETTFAAKEVNQQYVGIDLGTAAQVAPVTLSERGGVRPAPFRLTLSTPTPGATIRYSWNGDAPREDSGTVYSGSVEIKESGILIAQAFAPGLTRSVPVVTAYRIGTPGKAAKTVTTFHIGNSLTDTVVPWMEPIAASAGEQLEFHRFTIPGAPTDWLWNHPGSGFGDNRVEQAFLIHAPITHIFTQPFAGHGRDIANEADYSRRFYDEARKYSPDIQAWLYVQWPDKSLSDSWSKGDGAIKGLAGVAPARKWEGAIPNFLRYAEAVQARIQKEGYAGKSVRIVPAGVALATLKTEIEAGKVPGMNDFFKECFSDDLHLSPKGAYLVSLVHYSCIYGKSPVDTVSALQSGLTPEQTRIFGRIAWDTVRDYPFAGVKDSAKNAGANAKVKR
ncbi:MAG: chitobiase/beta-hexosaminidase C-terminal domain-containing protein [Akkermansiaceae bacterium]|nr:chitobiase/beta-hexosaminidase C-terminal domain-containing protein [Armatimonadota bacterium]